jgi:hypothetical protein
LRRADSLYTLFERIVANGEYVTDIHEAEERDEEEVVDSVESSPAPGTPTRGRSESVVVPARKRAAAAVAADERSKRRMGPGAGIEMGILSMAEEFQTYNDGARPVAAATKMFTRDFKGLLPVARMTVFEKLARSELAEIFASTDAESREVMVRAWVTVEWKEKQRAEQVELGVLSSNI